MTQDEAPSVVVQVKGARGVTVTRSPPFKRWNARAVLTSHVPFMATKVVALPASAAGKRHNQRGIICARTI
jgi:hypothetical protein